MEDSPNLTCQQWLAAAEQTSANSTFEQSEAHYATALDAAAQQGATSDAVLAVLRAHFDHREQHFAQADGVAPDRSRIGQAGITAGMRLLAVHEARFGPDNRERAGLLMRLAAVQWDINELRAFPFAEEAHAIYTQLLGHDHPLTLRTTEWLARRHSTLGQFAAAIPHWGRLLDHLDHTTLRTLAELGRAHEAIHDDDAAEVHWRRLLDLLAQQRTEMDRTTDARSRSDFVDALYLEAQYGIGRTYLRQARWDEAERVLRQAVAIHRDNPWHLHSLMAGAQAFDLSHGLHAYALALRGTQQMEAALLHFEEAIAQHNGKVQQLATLHRDYALALRGLGRVAEAERQEELANEAIRHVRARRPPADHR